jgi:hypothetical protein
MATKLTWGSFFLTFDAVLREVHTLNQEVTEHPVEQGAALVDHIRPLPLEIALEGVISNSPVYLPLDHADGVSWQAREVEVEPQTLADIVARNRGSAGVSGAFNPIASQLAASAAQLITIPGPKGRVYGPSQPLQREQAVYATLSDLRGKGELLTLYTGLATIERLALASVTCSRDASGGLQIQMTLRQVRLATVDALPETKPLVTVKAAPKKRVAATEKAPEATNRASLGFKVGDKAGAWSHKGELVTD